jgi:hypothetical protein
VARPLPAHLESSSARKEIADLTIGKKGLKARDFAEVQNSNQSDVHQHSQAAASRKRQCASPLPHQVSSKAKRPGQQGGVAESRVEFSLSRLPCNSPNPLSPGI